MKCFENLHRGQAKEVKAITCVFQQSKTNARVCHGSISKILIMLIMELQRWPTMLDRV